MKKLLFILSITFFCSCCPCKVEQTYFVVKQISSKQDSIGASAIFCNYHLGGELSFVDSLNKFKIGDTVVFAVRKRNIPDSTNISNGY